MSIFESIDDVPASLRHCALAIGNFDGVHLGHQALIAQVLGSNKPGFRGALTFSPHPSIMLNPAAKYFPLTTDAQKTRLLIELGLDFVIIHRLTHSFLELRPEQFIDDILVKKLAVSDVIVGEDFSFGAKASGKVADMAKGALRYGFILHPVQEISLNHERVSSSAIRDYLRAGDVKKAHGMLARPYALMGRVSSGQGLGGPLGFATANIIPPEGFALLKGIYATKTRVYFADGAKDFMSVTSVGTRPTITDSKQVVVESHCLDKDLNLRGLDIEIFFIERLRDEIKFVSISALQRQVKQDIVDTRRILGP